MPRTACVIGLGSMGGGAAASLLRQGFAVRGADPSVEARDRLAAAGGVPCTTPAEAARGADAVLVFVVNAAQTETALFGADGAAAAIGSGAVVLACATVPPLFAEELGRRLAVMGVPLLDAPVSGGPTKAATGEMTVMASGNA
ncbi:MAG TPA: NAD(P)-binding domain-containing protein [Acetobacteraceae bacterium]|nr:NAD(P)-binding domain-containing protein [Acetobacteraceae bacterium]